ncbi:hypothetical protein TWF718_003401 [Orbilia javanica]|uniref:Uncharacterized protein n=1 Tax=Orbilia javanica TaxID=47235 RepID=A0AAN8MLY0_9PEZI
MDSIVTVVPLTPEQLLQSPAEIYRAKQMAAMQQETDAKLAIVRDAVAQNIKEYETPRRIQFDKMLRDAEKKEEAAKRARQKPMPRRLPTPPEHKPQSKPSLDPSVLHKIPTDPSTPRRIRRGMSNAEIEQTIEDNEDWSDLINTSPSPAPRQKQQFRVGKSVTIAEPKHRLDRPLKSCLKKPRLIETTVQEHGESGVTEATASPEKETSTGIQPLPETPKKSEPPQPPTPPKPPELQDSSLLLKDLQTQKPSDKTTDASKTSSSSPAPKPSPPLPPRPRNPRGISGHLPLSIIRKYKAIITTICPPAWQMLEAFFSRISRPDAEYHDRDELIALVFWNCERITGKKMAEMPGDKVLRVIVDYVTYVLGEKDGDGENGEGGNEEANCDKGGDEKEDACK